MNRRFPAFQKALKLAPYHASAQFGLARAYQRKGDTEAAREGMKRFSETYGRSIWGFRLARDMGIRENFSLAGIFCREGRTSVPAEIAVRYEVAPLQKLIGVAGEKSERCWWQETGPVFLDFDGDGKADLFSGGGRERKEANCCAILGADDSRMLRRKAGLGGVGAGFGCGRGRF